MEKEFLFHIDPSWIQIGQTDANVILTVLILEQTTSGAFFRIRTLDVKTRRIFLLQAFYTAR